MPLDRRTARYLLLQARTPGDEMARHELECFADVLEVAPDAIDVHSLLAGRPSERALEPVDCLLIGGSGDFSVCGSEPWLKDFFGFLSDVAVDQSFPTFASCFGFQGLVVAGGGEVICDPDNAEVGTFDIYTTEAGERDPVTGGLAPHFKAQLGHKDRARRLPSGTTHLAWSDRAPYQAFRIDGTQVFATQFHPELTREANTLRYLRYQQGYVKGGAELGTHDEVLASMADSPGAGAILRDWVDTVLGS